MTESKLRFTDEEIYKANNIDIMDYAIKKGLELNKVGRDSYHVKGFGGLYINPNSNKWNCFSQDKGGGPIQLSMLIENNTWVEAVKELLGDKYESLLDYMRKNKNSEIKKKERDEFILPEKNNTYKHVIAYLIKTRNINKHIVYQLIKDQKLYEDNKRNCVFVGYDRNNNPRYANFRSTNPNITFKGEVKNSDKAYSFSIKGTTNKLYIFESPIEAISYLTILELNNIIDFKDHIVSLGGVSDRALEQYLKDNQNIKGIVCCLNNDKAGIEATRRIKNTYKLKYNVIERYPVKKDYNEDLNNLINDKACLLEKIQEKTSSKIYTEEEEFSLEF